ncbi:uncharacterized protein LOC116188513 isoform X2 [Punica granatum]|uniref:Uncharacterized protein LOC116188513 isoform X2 n=1 Tax=Punica granatum TaxID=22663 RepID=A0A6P8BVW7_PUNGR|nr:uncharacterized protein LOC116188513 isoform X2 [Punica granatum]
MPALKMKTKPVPSCGNEGTLLSVCRESSKICKRKHSVASESHETILETSKACQSGCCEVEEVAKESALDEPSFETCTGRDDLAFQERLLLDRDLTSTKMMESSLPMHLETSSSESLGATCKSDASSSTGRPEVPSEAQVPTDNCDGQSYDSSTRSSHEFGQSISDMAITALPSDEATGLDDIIRISFFQEFECAEPDLILDVTESCILLSSIDEQVNTPAFQDRGSGGELLTNSDNSWFHLVTHQAKPSNQAGLSSGSLESDETESFDAHLFIRNFLDLSDLETSSLPALLPKETCKQKRVTLVLDLDETLIHSTIEPCEDADFTFKVFFNMVEHTVYVRKRPFLKNFLERVSEMFEIVIFTASESVYAGQLLDMLDPERKFFSRRVYRDSCIIINGNYTKDLTILGVDLAKCAIVDNCPQVFQLQVNNGIPIPSWFDDPSDRALMSLLPFLESLADAEDVRPIIAKKFGVKGEQPPLQL